MMGIDKRIINWLKRGKEEGYSVSSLKKVLLKNGFDMNDIEYSINKLGFSDESLPKKEQKEEDNTHIESEPKKPKPEANKKNKHALGIVLLSLVSFILVTLLNLAVSAAAVFVTARNTYSLYILVIVISLLIGTPTVLLLKMLTRSFKRTAAWSFGISIISSVLVFVLTIMQLQKMNNPLLPGLFEPVESLIPSLIPVIFATVLSFNISLLFVLDRKKS